MNVAIWVLAGAALGWIGISFLRVNDRRGMALSMAIGSVGGYLGGQFVAPVFLAVAAVPADFSVSALFFAVAVGAVSLTIGNLVSNRYGV